MSSEDLLAGLRSRAELRRSLDAESAPAGEIKARSIGGRGIRKQQGKGARTAEILVQQVTGLSKRRGGGGGAGGESRRPTWMQCGRRLGVAKVDAVTASARPRRS